LTVPYAQKREVMNFPDWAPANLVELYIHSRKDKRYADENSSHLSNPGQYIAQCIGEDEKLKQMSEELRESYLKGLYRSAVSFPHKKGKELLGKAITDLRMASVWRSLGRRVKNESEFLDFWYECERAILGWLGARKLSSSQRKEFFLKIHKHASELSKMMCETEEFFNYSTAGLICSESLESLLTTLNAEPCKSETDVSDEELTRFFIAEGAPSIHHILNDIADKAIQFAQNPPLVRKPNSENAPVHYFIRSLSRYLKEKYGQPLHDVVAGTASVVFEQPDINFDYVHKLVRE
jgi:hypothetical protein